MSQLLRELEVDHASDELLKLAARQLRGQSRRVFLAEVCDRLCDGNARRTEERFGWGRETIARGIAERSALSTDLPLPASGHRGKQRSEDANPQLAIDIRLIVEPQCYCDPELKTERRYTNMTSSEVYQALLAKGYSESELPSERTLRDILNRMNYRLKRIRKAKPLKKTEHTDAIFENIKAVREEAAACSETLEISVDTKAKVKLGEFSLGGKNAY